MSPSIVPPIRAYLKAACGPLLIYNKPPVTNPAIIAFQGSSFYLKCINKQSHELKHPPHIANDPPIIGARFLT
jgi:hypothetical protein